MGSESYEKVPKIMCEETPPTDLENMIEQVSRTMLGVFHALKIAYLLKKAFFGICQHGACTNNYYIFCFLLFAINIKLIYYNNQYNLREYFTSLQDDLVNIYKCLKNIF